MKKAIKLICFAGLFFILTAAKCNKEKTIDDLPPETQEGKNTFGCLINGEVFLPRNNGGLTPIKNSYYQYIFPTPSGYVFQIKGVFKAQNCEHRQIFIYGDSILLQEGMIYSLDSGVRGGFSGNYFKADPGNCFSDPAWFTTNNMNKGQLNIKVFDQVNQIVAGTFWFDLVDSSGNTIKVTDGRFDMKYTR